MISFYPGPSKVWDRTPQYMHDAWQQGVLSLNHRSPEFVEISHQTLRLLHEKLRIPSHYQVLYTSSATECWEIIAQSLLGNAKSLHLFNGAFGEKCYEYTHKLSKNAEARPFSPQELPSSATLKPKKTTAQSRASTSHAPAAPHAPATPHAEGQADSHSSSPKLIALTHNETSNGTALPDAYMQELRRNNPHSLIAVDATSSMAGIALPFESADIWYASVQKCFGLPAGLGILICGPKAIERARQLKENLHYNSLPPMLEKIADAQTTYTPNVLGIYLLMRSLQDRPDIAVTAEGLHRRYLGWLSFFENFDQLDLLIRNPEVRSQTVLAIESSPQHIEKLKKAAKAAGFYLGNGYGAWKDNTFRIANFPALHDEEHQQLKDFLKRYSL